MPNPNKRQKISENLLQSIKINSPVAPKANLNQASSPSVLSVKSATNTSSSSTLVQHTSSIVSAKQQLASNKTPVGSQPAPAPRPSSNQLSTSSKKPVGSVLQPATPRPNLSANSSQKLLSKTPIGSQPPRQQPLSSNNSNSGSSQTSRQAAAGAYVEKPKSVTSLFAEKHTNSNSNTKQKATSLASTSTCTSSTCSALKTENALLKTQLAKFQRDFKEKNEHINTVEEQLSRERADYTEFKLSFNPEALSRIRNLFVQGLNHIGEASDML